MSRYFALEILEKKLPVILVLIHGALAVFQAKISCALSLSGNRLPFDTKMYASYLAQYELHTVAYNM